MMLFYKNIKPKVSIFIMNNDIFVKRSF